MILNLVGLDGMYTPGIHARHIILTNPTNNSKVHLIGCSHVDAQSSKDVQTVGQKFLTGPDAAVALELCPERTECVHPETDRYVYPKSFWDTPFMHPFFWYNFYVEYSSCVLGGSHGSEQKMGAEIAKTCGAPIYLIDSDISTTEAGIKKAAGSGEMAGTMAKSLLTVTSRKEAISRICGKELLAEAEEFKAEGEQVHLTPDPWTDLHISTGRDIIRRTQNAAMTYEMNSKKLDLPDALLNDRDYTLAHNAFRLSLQHETTLIVLGALHINGVVKLFGKTNEKEYLNKGGPATIPKYHGPVGTKCTSVHTKIGKEYFAGLFTPLPDKNTFVSDDDILTKAKVVGGIVYGGMVLGCTHSWRRMRKGGFRFFGRSVCTLITVGIPLGGLYGMKTLYDHGRRCQLETCRYDLKEGNIKSYAKIE